MKYQFLISYFELEVFVAASVKNFQMMEEELLENRIKDYQKNAQKQTTLFYWEMDSEVKKTEISTTKNVLPLIMRIYYILKN